MPQKKLALTELFDNESADFFSRVISENVIPAFTSGPDLIFAEPTPEADMVTLHFVYNTKCYRILITQKDYQRIRQEIDEGTTIEEIFSGLYNT